MIEDISIIPHVLIEIGIVINQRQIETAEDFNACRNSKGGKTRIRRIVPQAVFRGIIVALGNNNCIARLCNVQCRLQIGKGILPRRAVIASVGIAVDVDISGKIPGT